MKRLKTLLRQSEAGLRARPSPQTTTARGFSPTAKPNRRTPAAIAQEPARRVGWATSNVRQFFSAFTGNHPTVATRSASIGNPTPELRCSFSICAASFSDAASRRS